ncbi:MAG: hypothetical protein R3C61_10725 [Bacteroidia bacterium]
MSGFYRQIQMLSLDVVVGAVTSGGMVARLLDVEMPWIWWIALPVSVWVIYTADHLLDAWRLGESAHTERHLFHHHHFRAIATIWLILLLFCLFILPFLIPLPLLWFGMGMGGLVLIHLGLVQWVGAKTSLLLHKELGVASIYAGGVWGGPVAMAWDHLEQIPFSLFAQFFLLALINLLIFSLYEMETDTRDGHTSFVRAIGAQKAMRLIWALGLLVVLAGVFGWETGTFHYGKTQVIYGIMLTILLMLAIRQETFRPGDKYRAWGDAVFLLTLMGW